MELTLKCAANDAKFAKFEKLEELVKKHIPQVFHDEEDNESDDNQIVVIVLVFGCDIQMFKLFDLMFVLNGLKWLYLQIFVVFDPIVKNTLVIVYNLKAV